ncbi:hypothetical protein GDO81_018365 [Engystomops pustulosus]|uniref:Uncharacterized protein n=1 Tax=Engystomops pustulosus TaxID=76066 RepID=A0AAV7ABF9_ENGPU|nr:hypothetical protein GDO81_018365 [Engystomops pustulosus]
MHLFGSCYLIGCSMCPNFPKLDREGLLQSNSTVYGYMEPMDIITIFKGIFLCILIRGGPDFGIICSECQSPPQDK